MADKHIQTAAKQRRESEGEDPSGGDWGGSPDMTPSLVMCKGEKKMIKRAILSVSDKTGITQLARRLADRGVTLLSTGGTMKAIADAGIPVTGVSDVTGFP